MAKRVLTKFWQRYGENANNNGAFACILYMARIDVPLALEWSARLGGRYDGRVNQEAAQNLAETDADGALELLTVPGVGSKRYISQRLAEQFAREDRAKALKFAEEAAVQARADGTARPRRRDGEGRWLAGGPGTQGGRARAGQRGRRGRHADGLRICARPMPAATLRGLCALRCRAGARAGRADEGREGPRPLPGVHRDCAGRERPEAGAEVVEKIGERSSTPQSVRVAIVYGVLGSSGRTDEAVQVIEGMKGDFAGQIPLRGLCLARGRRGPAR